MEIPGTTSLVGWSTTPVDGPGFDGCLFTRIVAGPAAVRTVHARAVREGARELKPPRKALFASFAGFHRTPDGAVWKVVAANRTDEEGVEDPQPSELGALLGVSDVKAATGFYRALGMVTERSYGGKYADFHRAGLHRLGLMPRAVLAKDAGIPDGGVPGGGVPGGGVPGGGAGSVGVTLHARVGSVPAALTVARAAGARDVGADGFTDPEGFRWQLTAG